MNAAIVQSFDAPPRYGTFEEPVAGDGEAIVTVTAAGLHQIVRSLASGKHYGSTGALPFIPGLDGAGRLADGSRVFFAAARGPFGTMAERTITSAAFRFPIPDGLDDVHAAGMANPGMSSWAALKLRAEFQPGESVLILGATGSSGQLAVQIAKRMGARKVVAAGRNREALERLKGLGADAVIPIQEDRDALVAAFREEWKKDKIDVVLDYLWGPTAECLFEAISQKGLSHAAARIRFIQVGSIAGAKISFAAETLRSTGLEVLGSGFGSASMQKLKEAIVEFLAEAARSPFTFQLKTAPLRDVESVWNEDSHGARVVFQP